MINSFNQSWPSFCHCFYKLGFKPVNTSGIPTNYTRYRSKPATLDLPVGKFQIFFVDYPLEVPIHRSLCQEIIANSAKTVVAFKLKARVELIFLTYSAEFGGVYIKPRV